MGNVVEFKSKQKQEKCRRWPRSPQMEYSRYGVLITISWAAQVGRIEDAERLFKALKAAGNPDWLILPADFADLVEEADFALGMYGPEEDL